MEVVDKLRRAILRSCLGAGVCLTGLVVAYGGLSNAQAAEKVSIGIVAKDGSGIIPVLLEKNTDIQKKYGIEIEVKPYPSVSTVWTGFTAGEFQVLIGGPAGFAGLAAKGVPVRLMSTYATSNAQLFGKGEKVASAEDLKGKRVTAVVAGLWKLTEAQIKEKYGVSPGNGYELIPTPNLLSGVTQVLAGTADMAMGWEPDASRVRAMYPELHVVLQSSGLRPEGEATHIQVLGANTSLSEDDAEKFRNALADVIALIKADPVSADAAFAEATGAEKGLLAESIKSGRYNFDVHAFTPADKTVIKADILKTLPAGATLPEGFVGK
jgi:ABC-type nitrate/sulfonate/bicarbonate transport system substrate-binding protein